VSSSIDPLFAVVPTDDLTVEHLVLWSDGLRPAQRPVDPDNVGHVWASVSDHDADLHVLVVDGPGSSFSWSSAVCVVRGRRAVWTMTGPGIGMAELFAVLDEGVRALLATWGSELDVDLDPPDDSPIDTSATETRPALP
jgi:hypothetical protein